MFNDKNEPSRTVAVPIVCEASAKRGKNVPPALQTMLTTITTKDSPVNVVNEMAPDKDVLEFVPTTSVPPLAKIPAPAQNDVIVAVPPLKSN